MSPISLLLLTCIKKDGCAKLNHDNSSVHIAWDEEKGFRLQDIE